MSCNLFSLKLFSLNKNDGTQGDKRIVSYIAAPPSAPPLDGGQSYRLQQINEIQSVLEDERENRHNLSKKYNKAVKVVGNIDSALMTVSVGLSVAGVGILSTIIAVPAVIVMETTALGAGFLGIIGSQFNKMLMRKAEKHEKIIKLLPRLNSIR